MQFADNEGPDQPAQRRRLIRAVVVRLQNHWMLLYMSTNIECTDRMRIIILIYVVRQ